MRVVLREAAHAEEPLQRPRALVPVDGPHLGPPLRQVAVRELLVLEDEDVEGAVHRLELVVGALHLHLVEHAVLVEVEVARGLPQVDVGHVRRHQQLVAARRVHVLPVVLDEVAHARALRVPEDQPRAGVLLDREQVERLAEHAVVAPLGLGHLHRVGLELLGRLPRRAVDALQHRPALVAAPVRAGDRLELDRVLRQHPRVLDVRPRAQVPPRLQAALLLLLGALRALGGLVLHRRLSDVVDRDRRVRVALDDALQQLELVRLVLRADAPLRLLLAHLLAHQRQLVLDDLVHLLFDLLEVLLLELLVSRRVEVVVEALVDPRPDGHLDVLEEALHGHRHHVGARVADAEQVIAVLVGRQHHGPGRLHHHGRCLLDCRLHARASRSAQPADRRRGGGSAHVSDASSLQLQRGRRDGDQVQPEQRTR